MVWRRTVRAFPVSSSTSTITECSSAPCLAASMRTGNPERKRCKIVSVSHHGGYTAVQIPAHRYFLTGHFGVKIHEFHFDRRVDLTQEQVRFTEGTIGGRHVGAALQIEDGALHSIARLYGDQSVSRPFRIVGGPQQPRLAVQVIVKFALVPNMVAAGEHIQSESEKILGNRGRDTEPSRGVLRIGNRQVDLIRLDDVLHVVRHDPTPG